MKKKSPYDPRTELLASHWRDRCYHESFHIIEAQRTVPINTIDLTAAVLVVIIISHGDEMLLILSEDFEIGVY